MGVLRFVPLLAAGLLLPGFARAELPEHLVMAPDRLDPFGISHFHLVTRGMFKNGSAWSAEGRVRVRLTDGVAIAAVVPVGVRAGSTDADTQAFAGNVALGVSFGGLLSEGSGTQLDAAGGLDVYLPTAPSSEDRGVLIARSTVAAIRSSEPQLYIPRLFAARARGHFGVTIDRFNAQVELGLVPGGTVDRDGVFVLLASFAFRTSVHLGVLEPFLEADCTPQIAGDGDISPPWWITPGVRLHLADSFQPALFASVNFVESSAVIVGLDLAGMFRPAKVTAREDRDDRDDFLD